jgi:hypothetical protein
VSAPCQHAAEKRYRRLPGSIPASRGPPVSRRPCEPTVASRERAGSHPDRAQRSSPLSEAQPDGTTQRQLDRAVGPAGTRYRGQKVDEQPPWRVGKARDEQARDVDKRAMRISRSALDTDGVNVSPGGTSSLTTRRRALREAQGTYSSPLPAIDSSRRMAAAVTIASPRSVLGYTCVTASIQSLCCATASIRNRDSTIRNVAGWLIGNRGLGARSVADNGPGHPCGCAIARQSHGPSTIRPSVKDGAADSSMRPVQISDGEKRR